MTKQKKKVEAPEAVEAPKAVKSFGKIVNKSLNRLVFKTIEVAVKGEYILTSQDAENADIMARLKRADEINLIDFVK